MKLTFLFVILTLIFSVSCDRNKEDRQGFRQEMEEVTAPNDYTTGEDTKERRQTGSGKRLPVTEE